MPYRKWSDDEKRLVVLELLKGGKSVSQISKERGVSDALIYRWRDQALKAIEGAFKGNGKKAESAFSGERDRLMRIIGEQACVIETLKKISEMH
ncbi:MAG: transposase [Candidatus Omnitrophica bacterium]|nr:transposase [Candidatus Omnitrophota bacterium]